MSVVKTTWPWALAAVVVAVGAIVVAPVAAASKHESTTLAETFAAHTDAPGTAVAVVDLDGHILDSSTFGRDGSHNPIDTDTPFVWGSVSKSVMAAAVLDSGVDTDLSVIDALPFLSKGASLGRDVTVGDLLNHTSGLPHSLSATDIDRSAGALEVLEGPNSPLLDVDVSERGGFNYSSLNYLLLQAILERQGDLSSLLEHSAPGVITSYQEFSDSVSAGHVPVFGLNRAHRIAQDHAGLGYGYLAGSVEVLARYAAEQARLRVPGGPGERLPDTVARDGSRYASGWYVDAGDSDAGRGATFRHSGAVPGYFAHVALAPEDGKAVVALANRYGEMEAARMSAEAERTVAAALGESGSAAAAPGRPWGYILAMVAGGIAVLLLWVRAAFAWRARASRSAPGALLEASAVGLTAAAAIAVPAYLGYPVALIAQWAPDVAILLSAFGGFAVLLAGVCAATALTGRYRRTS
ncbi:Hypothetical protein BJL86_2340 [Dietzia timorensis]|uniref:Beta-lactamase-related domain-containing protein n=1 Tax=Dietzia timorensis TaxID=499555 RepID=A0A173LN71_9ACTN|nr:Hypothetical protein BJL86_2340 [Dietzia timorensis]